MPMISIILFASLLPLVFVYAEGAVPPNPPFNTTVCREHGSSPIKETLKVHATNLTSGYTIVMSTDERLLLLNELLSAKKYFEFGCGGSTMLASRLITKFNLSLSITSIDSSLLWVNQVRQDPVLANLERGGQFSIHGVDIGEVGDWGFPKNLTNSSTWPSYSDAILKYGYEADLVLVDGRFRVACALHAVLLSYSYPDTNFTALFAHHHAEPKSKIKEETSIGTIPAMRTTPRDMRIMVHDFLHRFNYHMVLHYTDVLFCADTLVVLRPKKSINLHHLIKDIRSYQSRAERN